MIEKYHIIKTNYIDDDEQKEIEAIMDKRTKENKEVAFSKIISIDIP